MAAIEATTVMQLEFDNIESAVAAVKQDYFALEGMNENLKKNQDVISAAISNNINALRFLPRVTNDKDQMLSLVSLHGRALMWASKELKSDREIVLAAVRKNGVALLWASEELQNDEVVVSTAIRQNVRALDFASAALQNNTGIVLEALKKDGCAIRWRWADPSLRNNKEIVLTAIMSMHPSVLKWASARLQKDKDIVMAAIRKRGDALQWASESLQDDKDMVMTAIRTHGDTLKWASKRLQDDKDMVMTAIKTNTGNLKWASTRLQDDKDMVMTAIKKNTGALKWASTRLQDDKDMVMTAIKKNTRALKWASTRLKNDKDVALLALRENKEEAIYWLSDDLLSTNLEVMIAALENRNQFVEQEIASKLEAATAASNCNIVLLAVKYGLRWRLGLKEIVEQNRHLCETFDEGSGLCPFMLSAASPFSDVETIFHLAKMCPNY